MIKNVIHGYHTGHLTIIINNNEADGFMPGFSHFALMDQSDGPLNLCFLINCIK